MTETTEHRLRALVLAAAPLMLLAGFLYHPYVGNVIDKDLIIEAVNDDPDRWAWAHILVAAGIVLVLVALLSVRHELRARGEERWSFIGVALAIFGGAFLATTTGTEIMLGPVANAGVDLRAVLDATEPWANGMYAVAGLAFSLGLLGFAVATYRTKPLGGQLDVIAIAGLVVIAVANWVPHSIAEYAAAVASAAALWPFAYRVWGEEEATAAAPGTAPA